VQRVVNVTSHVFNLKAAALIQQQIITIYSGEMELNIGCSWACIPLCGHKGAADTQCKHSFDIPAPSKVMMRPSPTCPVSLCILNNNRY